MDINKRIGNNDLLIYGFIKRKTASIITIPQDIVFIIVAYLQIIFDFDIVNSKKYGTNDILKEENMEEMAAVVVTLHSGIINVGFAGNENPDISIPNIIAINAQNTDELLIGYEANSKTYDMMMINPIENGEIVNWEYLKTILKRIFTNPTTLKHGLLMSECTGFGKKFREMITKFAFDQLKCNKFYVCNRCALAWYAMGRSMGVMLVSDYHCTEVIAIYEGYTLPHTANKINLGKKDISDYLQYNDDNDDGMEIMFNPSLSVSKEKQKYDGIHKMIYKCIMSADVDIRRILWCNIAVCGINTFFKNGQFQNRLQNEIKKLVASNCMVKVLAPPERREMSWIGGSILASLSTFEEMWITRNEYQEHGPSIVHTKCT